MTLICILFYCAAQNNFNIYVQHISVIIADALPRFQQESFRRLALRANLHPENIHAQPQQGFTVTSGSADIMVLPSQPDTYTVSIRLVSTLLILSFF